MAKFLGPTGLTVLWSRIKAWIKKYAYITSSTSGGVTTNTITIDSKSVIVPSKTSELNNDAGFITGADIPEGAAASSATPLMDGTASAGTSNAFARGDHRHPSDTSKANKPSGTVTAGHVATLDANGNLVDSGVSTSDYLPLTGGTITGSLTVNNGITIPTGSLHVQYGDLHVDKIHHNVDPNDVSASKVWTTNGGIADINTFLSGYLPLSGGTMTQSGPINFDTGGYIQYDSTTTGIKMVSPETITMTGTEGIQINSGGSNDIKLEGAREILLSGSQTTIYSDLYMRDGGVMAYDSADRSNTKVWNTSGGIVDLSNYATTSNVGQANGIASLDANGKVPTSQLPSYVDDVIEVYIRSGQTALSQNWFATGSAAGTVVTPEAGKIYVLMNSSGDDYPINSQYRWGGTQYVKLNDGGCTEMTESEMNIAVMGSDTSVWT